MHQRPAAQPAVYFKPERNARAPWFAVVSETVDGKRRRVWSPGQSSKQEAKAWAWAYKRAGRQTKPKPSPLTFGEWLDRWLAKHGGAPRTIDAYEGLFKRHIKPALGDVPLAALSRDQIQTFLAESSLVHNSRVMMRSIVGAALNDAVDEGLLDTSPASRIRIPRDRAAEQAANERSMFAWLWTPEEWQTFVKAAEGSSFLPVFRLLLATGARRGEVMALHWSDVDLDAGTVSITKSRDDYGTGTTKTGKARRVKIDAGTVAMLRELPRSDGLIFPHHPRAATVAWLRIIKKAGLRHMTLHGLRHMHATTLLSAGVPVTVVSKRLGHANVSMTLDTYSHVIPGQDEAAADVMGSAFA